MINKRLAEAIILQALDDLYDPSLLDNSVEFFSGRGYLECAAIAGMDHNEIMGILEAVSRIVCMRRKPGFREICVRGDRGVLLERL